VCVAGCLPPDVLSDLTDDRGREDGFIHRLLFAFPDPVPLVWTDAALSQETQQAYAEVFTSLWNLQPVTLADGSEAPTVVQFTSEGRDAFIGWMQTHYTEMDAEHFPEPLRGPWAKMEGYCARLALILQECRMACHESDNEAVDAVSVQHAAALMSYFKSHTKRVYHRLQTSLQEKRIALARTWLAKRGGTGSLRDFVTYKVAGCKTSNEARWLFQELSRLGYGTITSSTPSTGGPTSHVFTLTLHSANGSVGGSPQDITTVSWH